MVPITIHGYETTVQPNLQIESLVVDVSSISHERRDHLLNLVSSNDHIKSIYLLGTPPEISEEWSTFFTRFPKVCLFCEDEKHLAIRWALNTTNDCRSVGIQCKEQGDQTTARMHFQRGIDLYDRLRKLIDTTRSTTV